MNDGQPNYPNGRQQLPLVRTQRDWFGHLSLFIGFAASIVTAVWVLDGRFSDLKTEINNVRTDAATTKIELKSGIAGVEATERVQAEQIGGVQRELARIDSSHTAREDGVDRKLDNTLLQINGMAVNIEALRHALGPPSPRPTR